MLYGPPHLHIDLAPHQEKTGPTRHFVGGELIARPAALAIVGEPDGGAGFLLLYLDELGEEVTDTWHASVGDAMEQARFEFSVSSDEWSHRDDTRGHQI